jgi:protein-tyrosine phosphatase
VSAELAITVEFAGTGAWHLGNPPDPRSIAEAAKHGIDISTHRARQVRSQDCQRFGQIFALDPQNLRDLKRIAPHGFLVL